MHPTDFIGRSLPPLTVVVERGPVAAFARAVKDNSEVYQRPAAAREAGLNGLPVPPTFSFVMRWWGAFGELQPEVPAGTVELDDLIGALRADGGLILHADQQFVYLAPIVVGDVLQVSRVVEDVYTRPSRGGQTMTFARIRTDVRDDADHLVLTETMTLLHRP
ncbi:MaoC family dehydratase N-terminal domain-containing protein [Frankia gtarii]|uniref:MaoC family dehydratase N-terminal domain-containing protein n=1 Tax=Frankia gtarii TaxID=2950102 RepID=UPI0021C208DA|nr:MaoC family dehydratase N-terminal domain-containing protein [Frankia gtarii]